jgi:fluoroacetyl-CoA thioesterase
MEISAGLTGSVPLTVGPNDTAQAFGSGDVPVLATPRIVALVEEATVVAVAAHLGDGQTTVGTRVELDHLAATPIGRTVQAAARLVEVDGRRLVFEVEVLDGTAVAARGRVERVAVDRARFLDRVMNAARS